MMRNKLAVGEDTSIRICAKEKWNDSQIGMEAGETYYFEAQGKWTDLWKKVDADGFSHPLMDLYKKIKRSPDHNWFALMGSLDRSTPFLIGTSQTITMDRSGMFSCFANDAIRFYWNNSGFVELTITRIA
ncbi:MAG: hypothetical protein AAF587_08965 [Bacteroidota bacterium]